MACKEVVAILFSFTSCLACTSFFCVTNENVGDCQSLSHANYSIVQRLSDLSNFCETVTIYFARGDHDLTFDLTFSDPVQNVNITGIIESTIMCRNNSSGIEFSEVSSVNVKNFNLMSCNKVRFLGTLTASVSLFFYRTNFSLEYVVVSDSVGFGLVSADCDYQVIDNCVFSSNRKGNIFIDFPHDYSNAKTVAIHVANTAIFNGSDPIGGGMCVVVRNTFSYNFTISNCRFDSNNGTKGSHLYVRAKRYSLYDRLAVSSIYISNSIFSNARKCGGFFGLLIHLDRLDVTIENSTFSDNNCGAIEVTIPRSVVVRNCVIKNNREIGFYLFPTDTMQSQFINTTFHNNSQALCVAPSITCAYSWSTISIDHCNFTENNLSRTLTPNAAVLELGIIYCSDEVQANIVINSSYFERNDGNPDTCAALNFTNVENATLSNVVIQDNNCSGMSLFNSTILLQGNVSIMRNTAKFGGGIQMRRSAFSRRFSSIVFSNTGILNIVNNTASVHGGGIFTDESCLVRNFGEACPFQFQDLDKKQLFFSGNIAGVGGDVMSGGCLSNCYLCLFKWKCTNLPSVFWNLITSSNEQSLSTFSEYPIVVAFCRNATSNGKNITLNSTHQVSAYPGEIFQVDLIVLDDFDIPSIAVFQAKVEQNGNNRVRFGSGVDEFKQSKKYCSKFPFSVIGEAPGKSTTITFFMQSQFLPSFQSAQLEVSLQWCPKGFVFDEVKDQCDCIPALESINVECMPTDYSLKVPPQTWIGDFQNKVAVNQYCLHCNNEKKKTVFPLSTTSNSDVLCAANRTGILCGECVYNYSLQLGGYLCGRCTKSAYKGVLLILLFIVTGIFLIITLLSLNLTVSTGMINAIIFYSNIVHYNRENLLPGTELTSIFLENTVKFLSVFQAWVNLDFGITSCFFDGYDIYASTWMQFLFPAYIWLLVMLIVLASRYSNRISRLTSSSTVPVLATLLLLSYTKLLLTSISAFSFTNLLLLDSQSECAVWLLDGNILYLKDKHIPLFLVSMVCVLGFILPFTLLILLGPILQSKSDHRYLHWVNKIKPFLDAFYGPYTKQYRYWPGVLLLARIILFITAAFYSLGDAPYILASIAVMVLLIFLVWIALVRPHSVLPYHTRALNYLEAFFLINLGFFSTASSYFRFTKSNYIVHQQILAVVMVGTAFLAFCGIVIFQISHRVSSFAVIKKLKNFILARIQSRSDDRSMTLSKADVESNSTAPTQSTIELVCSSAVHDELREPLLTY